MKLSRLVEKLQYQLMAGDVDVEISTLVYDSRKVEKNCVNPHVAD